MWLQIFWLLLLLIVAGLLIVLLIRALVRLYVVSQGPFFAPTSHTRIQQIIALAELKPGMTVADLGSGDGRILIELVKAEPEIKAIGYELDPKYAQLSREKIAQASLEDQIEIKAQSFWEADLSDFDVITVYCVQQFMAKLGKKLRAEIKDSCKVFSVFFQFYEWEPKKVEGDIRLYQRD